MTLTARLLLFFLSMLALVLGGFSGTLFLLVRVHLDRQMEDRLEAALNTVMAGVEVEPASLEWEPEERQLILPKDTDGFQTQWAVCDEHGHLIATSGDAAFDELMAESFSTLATDTSTQLIDRHDEPWCLLQRRVEAPDVDPPTPENEAGTPAAATAPAQRVHDPDEFDVLVLTVGHTQRPLQTSLRVLAVVLTALSCGLWLLAALIGRWLCRRALAPVTHMAAAARSMDATDLTQRLPHPRSGDELEELGGSFNGLLDRLQESFVRQQRFTGDASHQLRTPLTVLQGHIDVALRRSRTEDEYRTLLATIKRQTDRLQQIVEALLFLTRADSEAQLDELVPIAISDWLHEHLATWDRHPRAEDLHVESAATGNPLVLAHALLLGQLVDNLLGNACKYSPPGTPIAIHVRGASEWVELAVADQGEGIAPEDLPHIFQPFYRSPRARRTGVEGVGLGLSVAQRIAVAFGGHLDVESTIGRGTVFTLRLPRLADGEADLAPADGQLAQDVMEPDAAVFLCGNAHVAR